MDGETLRAVCTGLYRRKPEWSKGSLSEAGALFLAEALVASGADTVIEIGTASGYSTALMATVLEELRREGELDEWRVLSLDISDRFYADPSRRAGDAARELVPELLDGISFHYFSTAADLEDLLEPDSIKFLFIDGSHRHPWPTLDLLLTLSHLRPGATVVMDDINLPLIQPQFPDWGAHYLFEELQVEKAEGAVHPVAGLARMGSVRIPDAKGDLRSQLLKIMDAHDWQTTVPDEVRHRLEKSTRGAGEPH